MLLGSGPGISGAGWTCPSSRGSSGQRRRRDDAAGQLRPKSVNTATAGGVSVLNTFLHLALLYPGKLFFPHMPSWIPYAILDGIWKWGYKGPLPCGSSIIMIHDRPDVTWAYLTGPCTRLAVATLMLTRSPDPHMPLLAFIPCINLRSHTYLNILRSSPAGNLNKTSHRH